MKKCYPQEALANSRGLGKLTLPSSAASSTTSLAGGAENNSGWFSWIWSWMSEWIYGPDISLHDCLAYFFSADELKGDNMYSCEKCKTSNTFFSTTFLYSSLKILRRSLYYDFIKINYSTQMRRPQNLKKSPNCFDKSSVTLLLFRILIQII